jgi:chitinase
VTVTATVTLPAGTQTLTLNEDAAGWNIDSMAFAAVTTGEGPYPGPSAAVIPGTVLAENYDTGGQGVGYNVTSTNGTDNGYRTQGVDLETATAPATGNDLGWSAAGQWFRYTVNASTAGSYTVSFLVASPTAVTDAFHLSNSSGTNLSGSVAVPATGGYQTWVTVTATVTLPAGTQTLTLNEDAAGWNIDSMAFASGVSGCTSVPGTPTGLAASGTTNTSTNLTWTASTIPSGCTLTNYTITGGPSSVTSTGTSTTVSGLTPNTSYTFTVKAADSFGSSAASSSVTVKTTNTTVSSYFVGGWYEEWGTYYANYNVSDMLNTGMVPSLTHVIYAFAAPAEDGSSCVLEDPYADYQKVVPLLSGAPALPTGLAGNLGGLWQLKQLYPNLKILISVGGWHPASSETTLFPYSFNVAFKAASATAASRQAFVSSCISTFIQGNIASGLTVPNLFDGVDIDWEFPNATETADFTALMTEFRNELTTLSGTTGKTYQVLADLAAGASTPGAGVDSGSDGGYDTIDIPGLSAVLDYMNVDGYNYAGDWSAATDEESPLYDDSLDTANALYPNNSIDYTVKYYLGKGAPAAKYTMGMPAYGVGWSGGLTSTNSGMYQTATGVVDPTGAMTTNGTAAVPNTNGVGNCPTGENQSSPTTGCDFLLTDGNATYRTIENLLNNGFTASYDSTRIDVNAFNSSTATAWSYDNPTSIAAKVAYIKANGLGGAYVWAIKDDDTSGSLTKALGNGLN